MSYEAPAHHLVALLGLLLTVFAAMDGFDLGGAVLLPFVAQHDIERRVVINTIGPVWEGNQVWFILGGGIDLRGVAHALCARASPASISR